jgi:hypothetical protein
MTSPYVNNKILHSSQGLSIAAEQSSEFHNFCRSFSSFTTLRHSWYQSNTILESSQILRGKVYSNCMLSSWWLQFVKMTYSNHKLANMHFMYGFVDGNAVVTHHLYQERYAGWICTGKGTFVSIHHHLCKHENFAHCVAKRRWKRSVTPEAEEDILDIENKTLRICTRSLSMHVGVTHSTVWKVLWEQLYNYHLQHVQALSLQDYHAQIMFCQWF